MKNYYNDIENTIKSQLDNYVNVQNHDDIYHYTSSEGLKGIIANSEIWFTNARFLNDNSENRYIFYLILDLYPVLEKMTIDRDFLSILLDIANQYVEYDVFSKRFGDKFITIRTNNFYTASFSFSRDALHLWKNYTANSIGYNIRFSGLQFKPICDDIKCKSGRVVYRKKVQEKILKDVLVKYDEEFNKNKAVFCDCDDINFNSPFVVFLRSFISTLEYINIFFKYSEFKVENEFRFVLYSDSLNIDDYFIQSNKDSTEKDRISDFKSIKNIKVKNNLFIPYISVKFCLNAIKEIGISPNNDKALYESGIKSLASSLRVGNINVWTSKIPIRIN